MVTFIPHVHSAPVVKWITDYATRDIVQYESTAQGTFEKALHLSMVAVGLLDVRSGIMYSGDSRSKETLTLHLAYTRDNKHSLFAYAYVESTVSAISCEINIWIKYPQI